MHQAVEQGLLLYRLLPGAPDGHESARKDFAVIGRASRAGRTGLHILEKLSGFLDCSAAPEYDFGGFSGELASHIGRAGLDDDRPALDWPRDVQRTPHRQMLALMIENVHLVRIEEDATRLVSPPRIVRPTVPKTSNNSMEFPRPPVAFVVPDMAGQPEIERRVGVGGRDDIPSRAAIADVVERCETASDMVRRVKRRRCRRDQTDPFRYHRESRKQRHGLE